MKTNDDFDHGFQQDVDDKTSLRLARTNQELEEFKQSMNEWIMFLNRHMKESRQAIIELENKVAELEHNSRTRI